MECIFSESQYGSIQIKTIAADFTDGNGIYANLKAQLDKLEVGILINNVGMLVGMGKCFWQIEDAKEVHDIVNCNIMSMARMCHLILPQMIKRGNGVIINIGSIACSMPTPYLAIYGGTKVMPELWLFLF